MTHASNPFHTGELKAQALAGAKDVSVWASGFIRDFMPEQHRDFYSQRPFLVLSGADARGLHWVTLLDGADGFITSPDTKTLTLETQPDLHDPLAQTFATGADVGLLGIDLATRRRNRLSGSIKQAASGYAITVRQSFGNCPQYIHERRWRRVPSSAPGAVKQDRRLTAAQIKRITTADTLFIGTGHRAKKGHPSNGFDASHRGGEPGFVDVKSATHLRIPDYAGNNFFNTIGNLIENPNIGLVFVDFETGGLLHISGRATIDWDATDSTDPNARRIIDVRIDAVIDRPAALALRWHADDAGLRDLVVTHKVVESPEITSFYLSSADGTALEPFHAGQHLPIELDIPGQSGGVKRSYSLSGSPLSDGYRLSIKREARGTASRYLHDVIEAGASIRARKPSGAFTVPCSDCPLVLASAGVGLTPMLSMLHTAARQTSTRPVWYVHGARNGENHALRDEVAGLIKKRPNLHSHTLYSQPHSGDQLGATYDASGRITAQTLLALNAGPDAHYMLCGPARFIAGIRGGLEAAGVSTAHIHFETFGPAV